MISLINKLDICYFNIINTDCVKGKEVILNSIMSMLRQNSMLLQFLDFLLNVSPLKDFVIGSNLKFLLLMSYDLNDVSKLLNVKEVCINSSGNFSIKIDEEVNSSPLSIGSISDDAKWCDVK